MGYERADPSGWVIRSCAALYQAWTWAPKRNHVLSPSLISRDGPSVAKVGTGDEVGGAGGGDCCADAAAATAQISAVSATWRVRYIFPFERLRICSSSAGGGCRRGDPPGRPSGGGLFSPGHRDSHPRPAARP